MSDNKSFMDLDSLVNLMDELQKLSLFAQDQILEFSPEKTTHKLYHYTSAQGLEGIVTNTRTNKFSKNLVNSLWNMLTC